ncbi:hypothetical protein GBZ48_20595 [Azospirillum melinis]|uniref:RiboL-PSP-HEPN domain-containing protein n=1 Tax=Azospirillum melinis TaxID=328839 RepID=A0ABX2KM00_9PROT|nr:HEPN domain-containing protein [Azospirillum melinis]MBP2304472.1 hypothetical protein [Azospirillum melinis]NUB01657.1 hypothetical protein [Azospirillum melinis]
MQMILQQSYLEIRQHFTETLQLLNHLESTDAGKVVEITSPQNALKGLFLVALYGSFERATNAIVEEALSEINSHSASSALCDPAIFTVFHHSLIQSLRSCSGDNLFEKSYDLFTEINSENKIFVRSNPIAKMLMNVDGATLIDVTRYFGIGNYQIDKSSLGRLNNLRERRNAVAHGRESAATAGERFKYPELRRVYEIADKEITRFHAVISNQCEERLYLKKIA